MNGKILAQISISESFCATLYSANVGPAWELDPVWEVYEIVDSVEMFSHYALGKEAEQLNALSTHH